MYFLVIKQTGEGCDYTIACGQKYTALRASTIEEAIEEAKSDYYCDEYMDGECEAEQMLILEVNEIHDLKAIMQKDHDKAVEESVKINSQKKIIELKKQLAEEEAKLINTESWLPKCAEEAGLTSKEFQDRARDVAINIKNTLNQTR